jgi:hypothetical protein
MPLHSAMASRTRPSAWLRNRLSVLMTLPIEERLIGCGCASEARIHARLVHGGEAGAADPLHALHLPVAMRGEHARGELDRKRADGAAERQPVVTFPTDPGHGGRWKFVLDGFTGHDTLHKLVHAHQPNSFSFSQVTTPPAELGTKPARGGSAAPTT